MPLLAYGQPSSGKPNLNWFRNRMEDLAPEERQQVPEWAKRFAVSQEGKLYFPAGLAGDEALLFERAHRAGVVAFRTWDEHVYADADWLMREYPHVAAAIRNLKRWQRENLKSSAR